MSEPIVSVAWSDHAVLRLRERLNAEPGDVDDLILGRWPVLISSFATSQAYAVDVRDVCRFVLNPDPNPKRVGKWVVVTVLDWDQRKGRGGKRVPAGRAKGKRKRLTLTDEEHEWTGQL